MKDAGRRLRHHLHGHQRRGHRGQRDGEAAARAPSSTCPTGTTTSSSSSSATCSKARSCAPTSPPSRLPEKDQPAGLKDYLEVDGQVRRRRRARTRWPAGSTPTCFVAGLKAAGRDFTRQKVIDAINEMTDYTADGFVHGGRLDEAAHREEGPRRRVRHALADREQRVRAGMDASRASRSSASMDPTPRTSSRRTSRDAATGATPRPRSPRVTGTR